MESGDSPVQRFPGGPTAGKNSGSSDSSHASPEMVELVNESDADYVEARHEVSERRILLPIALFFATCATTFWGGYQMSAHGGGLPRIHGVNWQDGLIYMLAVMGILLAHEMGHFLQAVRYRVPASLPIFLPVPVIGKMMTGTLGAVIVMQGSQANRKELFDIGLSGPLAGLVVAIPVTIAGILWAEPYQLLPGTFAYDYVDPWIVRILVGWLRPDVPNGILALNPLLMAGWVGFLITGLNMMPVSQLDGGHVIYALFGKNAHYIARAFVLAVIAFMVWSDSLTWIVMVMLVLVIGIDHPPTSDDAAPLGTFRRVLGFCSLAIPVFCFSPVPIRVVVP